MPPLPAESPRWRVGGDLLSGRTIKTAGPGTGVGFSILPQSVQIGHVGGHVPPGFQIGGRLNDIRGAGDVRVRIARDGVNQRRWSESEPIHIQLTRLGFPSMSIIAHAPGQRPEPGRFSPGSQVIIPRPI